MNPDLPSLAELRAALELLPEAASWMRSVEDGLETPARSSFRIRYAAAQRKLRVLEARPFALATSSTAHWTLLDWARLWLLREGLQRTPDAERRAAVEAVFEGGELGEQISLLRTLAGLDQAERYVDVGVAACRTNAVPVFEAIACENPYAARYFAELSFNQMVMKAVFLGLALSRVVGLSERVGEELRRMAKDYAAERSAAGRTIPPDLSLLGYVG